MANESITWAGARDLALPSAGRVTKVFVNNPRKCLVLQAFASRINLRVKFKRRAPNAMLAHGSRALDRCNGRARGKSSDFRSMAMQSAACAHVRSNRRGDGRVKSRCDPAGTVRPAKKMRARIRTGGGLREPGAPVDRENSTTAAGRRKLPEVVPRATDVFASPRGLMIVSRRVRRLT
jgi:hypothetical protein